MPEDLLPTILGGTSVVGALAWATVMLTRMVLTRKPQNELTSAQADKVQAEAAELLAGQSLKIIEAVRADAQKEIDRARAEAQVVMDRASRDVEMTRRDADEARRSAMSAWDEATKARREAMDAAALIRRMTTEILAPRPPEKTVDRLRELIGAPGPSGYGTTNGSGL